MEEGAELQVLETASLRRHVPNGGVFFERHWRGGETRGDADPRAVAPATF